MSKRDDIIDGSLAESRKYGLVYTEKCGWVDLGHANPVGGASELWAQVKRTQDKITARPQGGAGLGRPGLVAREHSRVDYFQLMGNRYLKVGIRKGYRIESVFPQWSWRQQLLGSSSMYP